MRDLLPSSLALLAAMLLQVSIAPQLAVFGVVPNLFLLVVVTIALVRGPVSGCLAGFAGGLLFDLTGAGVVGPWAMVLCTVGYVTGLIHANMFAEGWLLPVTVAAIASLAAELAHGVILVILDTGTPFWVAFAYKMLPGALYNAALAVLVYPFLVRVLRQDRVIKSFRRLG